MLAWMRRFTKELPISRGCLWRLWRQTQKQGMAACSVQSYCVSQTELCKLLGVTGSVSGGGVVRRNFKFLFFFFLLSFLPSLLQYKHIKKWSPCWRVMQRSAGARRDLKIYVCDIDAWKVRWKNWMKTCLHGAVQLGSAVCILAAFVSVITLFLP